MNAGAEGKSGLEFAVDLENGETTTALYYGAQGSRGVLFVFAHGAGAGQRHPFMRGAAEGLAGRGIDVVTFDFPYMHARRRVPDKAPVLEASFRAVATASRELPGLQSHRVFIGGKSMGGRMATHLGAQGIDGVAGIIALGYPLHPPGQPGKPRVSHLPEIAVPVLIVQGERDTFGTPAELEAPIATMKAPVTLHVVRGGDHSLAVRTKDREQMFASVLDRVAAWMIGGP